MQAGVTIKGIKRTKRWLEAKKSEAEKAMNTALKVEGFRLRNEMQKEIRAGAPGGRRFDPLSHISRGLFRSRPRPDRPLAALARAVRYAVTRKKPYTVNVGFIQPTSGYFGISKRWINLARLHQEGFTRNITPAMRLMIVRSGARKAGWKNIGGDTSYTGSYAGNLEAMAGNSPFFLRKETTQFRTPARPIIAPFWQAHQASVRRNIQTNFRRKMAGQRI